jgi:hypothetical protein
MERAGCSTVFEYRQRLKRRSLRRGSEEGDTDMENIHERCQPVEVSTTTESKRALDVDNRPNDLSPPPTTSRVDQDPDTLIAALLKAAQLAGEQAQVQDRLAHRYEELALRSGRG